MSNLKIRQFEEDKDLLSISEYDLPEEQAIFTTIPSQVIETFKLDKWNQPYVVLADDDLAGFFVLYGDPSGNFYTDNKKAIVFKSFSIDLRHQKKGYALQTLEILPALIKEKYPDKDEILLTVHHTNTPAIHLYKKSAFLNKGIRYAGEYGEELVFHYEIKRD
ncbi:GNAT family N-acetyltransferase [Fictibacillus barbaricus]|uniref:Ribosomal protein S18 acetylase RimI-like enzyme n=1 Tax=Fictibacillus barbaricus TaxID=182136 RepID=A0ABU1TW93_9BACL|nr:GNAT family N-acetyltransferase [Fictibacillus barbaricus]MDR7071466.1 ribosomal protein S18 acetylase RimI-like enzyme [Fictibacillus barbaricus]